MAATVNTSTIRVGVDMNGHYFVAGKATLSNDYVTKETLNLSSYLGNNATVLVTACAGNAATNAYRFQHDGGNVAAGAVYAVLTSNGATAADNTDLSNAQVAFLAVGEAV